MATPRGRWFLKEFAARNKSADTDSVLEQLAIFQSRIVASQEDVRFEVLQSELREMAKSITETRTDIASLQPDEASTDRIEAATGELDAIVDATENATSSILAAAEELQMISEKLREAGVDGQFCDDIETHTTDIFMACSFQDITGQRISKVVSTLNFLEQRVNMMIEVWGIAPDGKDGGAPKELSPSARGDTRPDAGILGGPAAEGEGFSQEEIDAMLDGDFSAIDKDKLDEARQKADAAENAVNASDTERFAQAGEDAVETAPEAADVAEDDSPGLDGAAAIDQDDIDSLFG